MLRIFKAPEAFSFGLEDRFNIQMEQCLNRNGVPCIVRDLWSDFWARALFFSKLPYFFLIYREALAPCYCWLHAQKIQPEDVVWVNGPSLPVYDTGCWFEKKIIRRGAKYVFWVEDDWFSDPNMKASAEARMDLADLIVAVTPTLQKRIAELYPGKPLILLEEPIDVERLEPKAPAELRPSPLVLWGGRPWGIQKLSMLNDVLERIYREIPFTLRIITGVKKPECNLSIPWEWFPYDRSHEAQYAAGAVAGLAPLEDTVLNSCKGNYKVKTYMALGIPPLASPIGYNHQLIRHRDTGFLLDSPEEWEATLRLLLQHPSLAAKIGAAARLDIVKRFSYENLMPVWAKALQKVFPNHFTLPGVFPDQDHCFMAHRHRGKVDPIHRP